MKLDHCCLNVRDMDKAIEFYTTRLKMELMSRREVSSTNAEIAFLGYDAGGMKLELTHWRDWGDDEYEEGTQFDHIAIVTDDVRGLVDDLREKGVTVAKEPFEMEGSGSVIAFVNDLDGNWVELIERSG